MAEADYYARLERGQIAGASSSVLEALARAVRVLRHAMEGQRLDAPEPDVPVELQRIRGVSPKLAVARPGQPGVFLAPGTFPQVNPIVDPARGLNESAMDATYLGFELHNSPTAVFVTNLTADGSGADYDDAAFMPNGNLVLTDGALRMLVLLYFHERGYSAVQVAMLFLFYEVFGVVTNLVGGWIAGSLPDSTTTSSFPSLVAAASRGANTANSCSRATSAMCWC